MNRFSESQRFKQVWIWIIILLTSAVPVGLAISEKRDILNAGAWAPMLVTPVLLVVLFRAINLKTTIDSTGVSYRFSPFHLKPQKKTWEEIDRAFVREYSPLREYGGWGMRYSFGKGRAYNISGNMGLQLVLKNDKKILIGTIKPDEINAVLQGLISARVIEKEKTSPTIL